MTSFKPQNVTALVDTSLSFIVPYICIMLIGPCIMSETGDGLSNPVPLLKWECISQFNDYINSHSIFSKGCARIFGTNVVSTCTSIEVLGEKVTVMMMA